MSSRAMERALTTDETNLRILVSSSPDPKACERYLEAFQSRYPERYKWLSATSSGLQYLTVVFSYSRFLSDALLQFPSWLDALLEADDLYRVLSVKDFVHRLDLSLDADGPPAARSLA